MLSRLFLALIQIYRWCISPFLGVRCRFYPSCSEYAATAIRQYGAWRGGWMAICRLGRCHPWHPGGYDPVPDCHCHPTDPKSQV